MLVAAFALIESRHPAPLVPLRILRSRTLAGADALTVLIGTVAVGMPFVLTLYAQQVLGYSALKFGVSSVVLAVGATAGAIAGQAAVLKAGFRPVAATGLALMGAGSLVLTQVSVHGSYFPDIFVGLLLCGLGIGLAFVTATVAALAGVAEHEAGLASGLSNTALQIGTALGVAIVTTVAVSRSQHYLAAQHRREPARRADRGLPVRLPGLRRAGRDRPGAGAPAPRPAAESSARAARAGPGGQRSAALSDRQERNEPTAYRFLPPTPPAAAVADNANRRRTEMGKIVVSENVTLDGVIQDPAGDEGFRAGGWVGLIKDSPQLAKLALDEALAAEALLLGRRSYEWFAARWPSRSGELADRLNSLPKYVVSATLEHPAWNNSTVLKGDVLNEVSTLKQQHRRGHRHRRQLPARTHADRARPGRRAAAEDLPGRARGRRAPVRRDQRQETHAPPRHPDPRGRHRLPYLPACPGRLAASDGASVPKCSRALSPGQASGRAPHEQQAARRQTTAERTGLSVRRLNPPGRSRSLA